MALLKSASEVLDQGHDFLLRGDFSNALARYNDAAKKYQKLGDINGAAIAGAYAAVMSLALRASDPAAYRQAVQSLRSLGPARMKLGVRESTAAQLAREAELLASEIELIGYHPASVDQYRQKARSLRDLATAFRADIGSQVLAIPELLHQGSLTGESKALPLAAHSEEALAESLLSSDPKAAAGHYQTARLWWSQAGYGGQADSALSRVQQYGRAARCWFCGRDVAGEGVHFVPMLSELTELVRNAVRDSPLPSYDAASGSVYACKGCYGAVYRLADGIATKRVAELEARVQAQIEDLKRRVASLHAALAQRG
ncbi:MAG TPA: hypothetical protein VIB49_03665 [Thermoplasmata archaeon]